MCEWLPDQFEVSADDVEAFVASFELLRSVNGIHLYRCELCCTFWYFDYLSRSNLAVKLANEEDWGNVDADGIRQEVQINQMLEQCGGYSDEICKWKDCTRNAVKGRAFCPYHPN